MSGGFFMSKNVSKPQGKYVTIKIRISFLDLEKLKQKAAKLGLKYQTFIAEILHKVAQS